jgi:hypothetical protein
MSIAKKFSLPMVAALAAVVLSAPAFADPPSSTKTATTATTTTPSHVLLVFTFYLVAVNTI